MVPVAPQHRRAAWALAAAAIAAALLYLPALLSRPAGDDLQAIAWAHQHGWNILFPGPHFRLWDRIVHAAAHAIAPLQLPMVAIAVCQLAFAASVVLVWRIAGTLLPGRPLAPWIAAALFAAHPANASALIQLDVLSQALAAMFTLGTLAWALARDGRRDAGSWAGLALLAFCSLLAKETSAAVLAWLPIALGLQRAASGAGDGGRSLVFAASAVGVALACYLALRLGTGTALVIDASERYSIHFSPGRVVRNFAQLLGASLYFGNTADAFAQRNLPALAGTAAISVALLAATVAAAWRQRRAGLPWPRLLLIASFVPVATAPMVLMGSVSELYCIGITPFVALTAALLLDGVLQERGAFAQATMAVLAVTLAAGVAGVRQKEAMHHALAERSWAYVGLLRPAAVACGEQRLRVEASPPPHRRESYSAFLAADPVLAARAALDVQDPLRTPWIDRALGQRPPRAPDTPLRCQPAAGCVVSCGPPAYTGGDEVP